MCVYIYICIYKYVCVYIYMYIYNIYIYISTEKRGFKTLMGIFRSQNWANSKHWDFNQKWWIEKIKRKG